MTPLLLLLLAPAADAKTFADVAAVTTAFEPAAAKPGQVITLVFTVAPKPGCYTYPADPPAGQVGKNRLAGLKSDAVLFLGPIDDPPDATVEPNALGGTDLLYRKPATWRIPVLVKPDLPPGARVVKFDGLGLLACNKSNCLPGTAADVPAASLEILPGPAVPISPETAAKLAPPAKPAPAPPAPAEAHAGRTLKTATPPAEYAAALDGVRTRLTAAAPVNTPTGLLAFLATAAFWGFVSLATPCIFPMIPITVSLFLKQGKQSAASPVKLAFVYSLTIVVVLGVSAVVLLSAFVSLSRDPVMNLFLGGLFVVFALSLFGMYDITLPGGLLRFTERRSRGGGVLGTVFGAVAFSIVGFTCVAPFLGGFAGLAASGQFATWQLVLGGLTFAAAFASPFFLLALFPSWLKKLPRSGGWLDTLKAVMGFLELAAALKFFRTAELRLLPAAEYFTYDLVLAGWVAVAAGCGLYLLNAYRLPHDDPDAKNIGVPRLVFGLGFLGLALYLLPALFGPAGQKPRPAGVVFAWVDSFLLPEPAAAGAKGELPWGTDLPAALAKAKSDGLNGTGSGRVFVDFTGVTCTNCALNEKQIFPMPEVESLLKKYTLVQLYTDEVPAGLYAAPPPPGQRDAEGRANFEFQKAAFGTSQLPLYAVLEPLAAGGVRVVAVYDEGKINDPAEFAGFLRKSLSE